MAKARSDSKLKNLEREQQELIVEWLRTPKSKDCVGGQLFALAMIKAEFGIETSKPALTSFLQFWELQEDFEEADLAGQFAEEQMLNFDPENAEKAKKFGDFVFQNRSLRKGDGKTWVAIRRLKMEEQSAITKANHDERKIKVSEEKLRQSDRRIKLLESNQEKAKADLEKVKDSGGITPETRKLIENVMAGLSA